MKTLLWKDYRHNRRLLGAATIFLLIPYLVIGLVGALDSRASSPDAANLIGSAGVTSLGIATLLGAFIAGNAIAGQRGDRSAEFAGYLPIPRRHALLSKAALALGSSALFWLVNLAVFLAASPWMDARDVHHLREFAALAFPAAVLLFGASWLLSSFLSNPSLATLSGLGSAMTFIIALVTILKAGAAAERLILHVYLGSCPALGLLCFIIGAAYYLRRLEP
ncbi:MAG: hypothetical protein JXQ73_04390 [Phycisphaerae bacterium]|nr:hypothetical protein [Phycisphaerae bacterium]